MSVAIRLVMGVVAVSLGIGTGMAVASPQMVAKAKGMGMPVKNCQYCHTDSAPKKDTFKPESLNERGKYLYDDMQARKLKTADLEKLKDFPGGKEQK
jgi:cytochrome c553